MCILLVHAHIGQPSSNAACLLWWRGFSWWSLGSLHSSVAWTTTGITRGIHGSTAGKVQKRRLEWKLPRGAAIIFFGEVSYCKRWSWRNKFSSLKYQPLWHWKTPPFLPSVFHRTHKGFDWPHQEGLSASPPNHPSFHYQKLWGWPPGDSWFPIWNAPNLLIAPFQPLPNLDLSFSQVFCIQIKNDVH